MLRIKRATLTKAGARRIGYPNLAGARVSFTGITVEGNARRVFYAGELIARNLATRGKEKGLEVKNDEEK